MHNFKFGNHSLSEFGGRILKAPSHSIAERDFELIEIPGKNGALFVDNGKYRNVPYEIPICLMPFLSETTARQLAYAIIDWLAPLKGYYEYRDTYNPGYFTRAVLTNIDEIKRELPNLLTTKLSFSREPYWYRTDGLNEIEFSNDKTPVILNNPEPFEALPIITLYDIETTEKAAVNINGSTANMPGENGCVERVLDGMNMQYIGYKTDGTKKHLGPQLPSPLSIGKNKIFGMAHSGSFKIIPNWRRL